MKEPTEEQVAAFMEEFIPLAKKHGLMIAGCGCCGSPWIGVIEEADAGSIPDRIDLGLEPKEDPIPPFKMD
jgi:hypothetical protein